MAQSGRRLTAAPHGGRVVSGGRWTTDGRWVVVARWYGHERIVFDPGNGDPWSDLQDCLAFVRGL